MGKDVAPGIGGGTGREAGQLRPRQSAVTITHRAGSVVWDMSKVGKSRNRQGNKWRKI